MKLTFASRILAGYLLVFGVASWVFYDALVKEIKPVVRQSAESVLIDTANILAELVSAGLQSDQKLSEVAQAVERAQQRRLSAIVWEHERTDVILNFYITDQSGTVVYSSEGKDVGQDYSQWRDVYLTLRGDYGARSTPADPYNPESSVMYVAAPIFDHDEIVGVLTVYNPNETMLPFVDASRKKVLQKWFLVLVISGVVALILSFWLSQSIGKLLHYANRAKTGEAADVPQLLGSELNELARALEDMRIKLEGKAYVEHYVQTLTHELKSPLAAIRGAAEMLQEDLPADVKSRFLNNVHEQNDRMQRTIDQLLRLAALENQKGLVQKTLVASQWVQSTLDYYQSTADQKAIELSVEILDDFEHQGDAELLRLALGNVIENALDFSANEQAVNIQIQAGRICVLDEGSGIPDYALDKIGSKFFSLPRPNGQPKSTGLGLALSKEICRMHQANLTVQNRSDCSGAQVVLQFSSHNPHT